MRISTIDRLAKNILSLTGVAALEATTELRDRLLSSLERSKVLGDFTASERIDKVATTSTIITLQYKKVISPFYATELTFTVNQGKLQAFVRTLHLADGAGSDSKVSCVAGNGTYSDEVQFYSVEGLAKAAVQRGLEHRVTLMQDLGFVLSRTTQKKLLKSAGCLAL